MAETYTCLCCGKEADGDRDFIFGQRPGTGCCWKCILGNPAARRASPRDSPVTWLYVTYPGTGPCFALICDGGRVVTCPPAARWARGEETAKVVSYYRRRGIKVEDFRS